MDIFDNRTDKECSGQPYVGPGTRDTQVQLVISLALGLSAFLAFCALRPRWKSLYAARKRHFESSIGLPALPDTFFGWIPALYRVTEQEMLASAGLDAFVFLRFFKMSIKLFGTMFIFAVAVLEPINIHFLPPDDNKPAGLGIDLFRQPTTNYDYEATQLVDDGDGDDDNSFKYNMGYLWSYLVFTYFFTWLTLYFMDKETRKVIKVRQEYLGTQSTITDRTFRLSGIPKELATQEKIKDLVEELEIGNVESVTLCRNWKEIDDLMEQRQKILAQLEETWSVYLAQKPVRQVSSQPNGGNGNAADEEAGESDNLIQAAQQQPFVERERPKTRLWYGLLGLQSRKTDALDYFTEKLRLVDEKIIAARKKNYEPTGIAFVTMDSIAACQMAIQALIDPRPGHLLTKPAPAPSDVMWRNTYASRTSRQIRSWTITIFITVLTVVWLIPVATLASTLSICTIDKLFPSFARFLKEHETIRALVQTGLPTGVVSLLNIAVPYFYDYLSYHQGMISHSDIALSAVSKNFFFTFFNIFLVFTVFGTVTSISGLRDSLKDTTYLAYTLASQVEQLSVFYTNFIMLQGIGLFPFRLLEFGSVALYPIQRLGAKTPRDFAEIDRPPMFYYGFYLPTALLVFILCLVYSTLRNGYQVLGLGVAYFVLGYFTYKYQLIYAMDQPQHATGGAWRIICYRLMLGLLVFQLTMSGYLALRKAFIVSLLVLPLFVATIWYSWSFRREFEPLTHFISLRSIKRRTTDSRPAGIGGVPNIEEGPDLRGGEDDRRDPDRRSPRRGSTVDEDREKGLRFVNPNLVVPLEQPWIYADPPPPFDESQMDEEALDIDPPDNDREYEPDQYRRRPATAHERTSLLQGPSTEESESTARTRVTTSSTSSSSVSLGDTHVWRS